MPRSVMMYADAVDKRPHASKKASALFDMHRCPDEDLWSNMSANKAFLADLDRDRQALYGSIPEDKLLAFMKSEPRRLDIFLTRPDPTPAVRYLLMFANERALEIADLERVCDIVTGRRGNSVRVKTLNSTPDGLGRVHSFLTPDLLEAAMGEILNVWNGCYARPRDFPVAAWLIAALINAHPFPDGNGRVAYALAAAHLMREGYANFVFPFAPYVYLAGDKFILAERRASIAGDWSSFLVNIEAFGTHFKTCASHRAEAG